MEVEDSLPRTWPIRIHPAGQSLLSSNRLMDEFLIGRYMFSPKFVMSKRLNPERTRFALPILATAVLAVLFLHQSSDSPTILSRYSVGYVVMLLLAGLNVILLWRRPPVPALRTAISAMV